MSDVRDRTGLLQGVLAYGLWGVVAAYWKPLAAVDPVELIAHRAIWGLCAFGIFMIVAGQWRAFVAGMRDLRLVGVMAASASLLAVNWTIFVAATTHGHLLDASLGYFISPLINVLFGYAFLHERLRTLQWSAVGIAAAGVAWLTWQNGTLPWIGLALAASFGGYGLLRKTAQLGALEGLALETLLLFPVALIYLSILGISGASHFGHAARPMQLLLVAAGPVTAVPLLLFGAAARRIPLSTLGLIQYVTPTLQLLTGVLVYQEPFGAVRAVGYGAIWIALTLYSFEGLRASLLAREARREREAR